MQCKSEMGRIPFAHLLWLPAILFALAGALGCVPALIPGDPLRPGSLIDPCLARPGAVIAGEDPIVIAVRGTVRPERAPVPANDAERILFGMMYEPLIRIDCEGNVRRCAAREWTVASDSTEWVFTLSTRGVKSGRPELASDWVESWGRSTRIAGAPALLRRVYESSRAEGETTIHIVWLWKPQDLLRTLAHPAAALADRGKQERGEREFPLGTGAWRIDTSVPTYPGDYLLAPGIRSRPPHTGETLPPARPILVKTGHAEPELDLLRDDHDVVFVRHPEAWRFAAEDSYLCVASFDREVFVIATHDPALLASGTRDAESGTGLAPVLPALTLEWNGPAAGRTSGSRGAPKRVDERVVYPAWRDDARALAERFVARVREDDRFSQIRAAALPAPGDWYGSLEAGEASAYVLPLHVGVGMGDGEGDDAQFLRVLNEAIPWAAYWAAPVRVRSGVAVRSDLRNIAFDADGFPLLDRIGRSGDVP